MPKEVEALRASLNSRLTALEKALADPKQHGSLEALILDLARLATEEADATARHAVVDAQKAAQSAAAAARTEALEAPEAAKKEAAGASRELAALRESVEQQQAAGAAQLREIEAARRIAESERAAV